MRKKFKLEKNRKFSSKFVRKKKDYFDINEIEKIKDLAEALCGGEGFKLVLLEWINEPRKILRVCIDRFGETIGVDDCADISRQLSDILDVEFDNIGSYFLEVSSPGLDRVLVRPQDFVSFGKGRIVIKLIQSVDGRKNFSGEIVDIREGVLQLIVDGETIAIRHNKIESARLIVDNGDC